MTTLVEIFEFSLLYINTLALNPQCRVTCIVQRSSSQDKCLKGLSAFPFQPSQAGGPRMALKFFPEVFPQKKKKNSMKNCMLRMKPVAFSPHPNNSVEDSKPPGWVTISRADPSTAGAQT